MSYWMILALWFFGTIIVPASCSVMMPLWETARLIQPTGAARNIRHLPCVSRRTGETGLCMFAYSCAKANGTHLGTCIDRFYFGSCCKVAEGGAVPDPFSNNLIPNKGDHLRPFESAKPTKANVTTTESSTRPSSFSPHRPSTNFQKLPTFAPFPNPSSSSSVPSPSTISYEISVPLTSKANVTHDSTTSTFSTSYTTSSYKPAPALTTVGYSKPAKPPGRPSSKPKPTPSYKPTLKPKPPGKPSTKPTTVESTTHKVHPSWVEISVPTHAPTTSSPSSTTVTSTIPTTSSPSSTTKTSTIPTTSSPSSTTETTPVPATSSPSSTTETTTQFVLPDSNEIESSGINMSDYKDVCGRRLFPHERGPTARIVGGERSYFGKWPWQISLRQWRTSTYLHKCGAALFNENWAVTAAHCVENVPPSDLLLRLGEHDLSTEEEPYGYQERRVQIVASHPQFDPRTFEYDLALLRFYEPVKFQPNIIPICVPDDDTNFVGSTAHVTGWGRMYEDGPLPSVLQEVSVPVINNTVCETMYKDAGYEEHIPDIFICAGWRKGGFDSCEGDSGGPMVLQRPDKRWILAGIISWGIGCAEPNQPGVYTRISEFRDWINQILQF